MTALVERTSLVFALSVLRLVGSPVALADSFEPKDNQYYAWIQDLVSGSRSRAGLAEKLRRNRIVPVGGVSRV